MTSFDFAVSCGVCHPGGGPLEYDRKGNRYDLFASDPNNKITSAGENNFDGDYYKARWAETGILEADCLLCHTPGYEMAERNRQLSLLNFRWAATAGAGLAKIDGSVKAGERPVVSYRLSSFDAEGHLSAPLIKAVPAENCLFCHRETDWKKKGTSYLPRFDVHLRAGMKCVECHPAGRSAPDPRINSKEDHNIGKGDDPGNLVRDDLDNTVISCEGCHEKGLHNAPLMKHARFKEAEVLETHLEKLSCLTCHLPQKAVKAALVQDSTVLNVQPRAQGLKRIWSFYGPDALPWNYYGDGDLVKGSGKPLFFYAPQLRWYKGKIYPVNTLYSIWYGLKREGREGLDQVFMQDIWGMWSQQDTYPLLKKIEDDNGNGFIEINRPEEIDAALASMTAYLKNQGTLDERAVVFVDGQDVHTGGRQKTTLSSKEFEYSPYGATFKLSHDVAPAGAALGADGCNSCHSKGSAFFSRPYLLKPFDSTGTPVMTPAYKVLGYSEEDLENLEVEQEYMVSR